MLVKLPVLWQFFFFFRSSLRSRKLLSICNINKYLSINKIPHIIIRDHDNKKIELNFIDSNDICRLYAIEGDEFERGRTR